MARGALGTTIYWITAPVRLFGRSARFRLIVGAPVVVAIFFSATLWALDRFFPGDATANAPKLAALPLLKPLAQTSFIIAPVAIALPAIQAALEKAAPHNLSGKSDNPVSSLLSKADVGVTVNRGAIAVTGRNDGLVISTPVNGTLKVTGQIATQAGNLTGTLTRLFNRAVGKQVQTITNQVLDQHAEVHGNITIAARPALTPAWRIEPNMSGQVALGNSALSLAGIKIKVASEVKPLIDREVNAQIAALQNRLRNDPIIERSMRREWSEMCRSMPFGGGNTGLPELWLELKPTRAAAAQPKIDGGNFTLIVGVQGQTRVVAKQTKPDCPFPAQLDIVPQLAPGLTVGLPIDLPFTDVNKLLEAQLKGRRFPNDPNAPVEIEVRKAHLAASRGRLLISLLVKAREQKSWFGFGATATLHIWGKPVLDQKKQILRLTDLSLAVESQAAFGLLGAAAQAAVPYLKDALAENAVIDLKPFAADAKKKIADALAQFRQTGDGARMDAAVDDLRLTGIEFDSKTLRVIAEATGRVNVAVSKLPSL
ncbi:MAG TPA: DUF4403 family protein [Pseudolabrys sp.]|nr:DUF4403 family protein [Pseudolabrys sp.]